jgi:signal transduction histidine kinase
LGKALKFTPEGGRIILSLCDDSPRGWVLVSVTDTGEGVPEEYLERIFDKFEQVANRKAGRKMSTGLGLTFCRLAVEAQGGKIWAESPAFAQARPDAPKGSRFTFTLPTKEK